MIENVQYKAKYW